MKKTLERALQKDDYRSFSRAEIQALQYEVLRMWSPHEVYGWQVEYRGEDGGWHRMPGGFCSTKEAAESQSITSKEIRVVALFRRPPYDSESEYAP